MVYESIMESGWHDARASPLDCATHDLVMKHTFANDGVPLQRSLSRKNGDEHDSLRILERGLLTTLDGRPSAVTPFDGPTTIDTCRGGRRRWSRGEAGPPRLNNAGGLPSRPLPPAHIKGHPKSPVCEHAVPEQ